MFAKFNFNNGFSKNNRQFDFLTKTMMVINIIVVCVVLSVVSVVSYKVYKLDWSHGIKGVVVTLWCGRGC